MAASSIPSLSPVPCFEPRTEELKQRVLRMGSMVEEALNLARGVLAGPDRDAAPRIQGGDARIDALFVEIEEGCLEQLTVRRLRPRRRRREVVRLVLFLQIVRELERIGDYCKRLARTSEDLLPFQPLRATPILLNMLDRSRSLLTLSLEALARDDNDAWQRLESMDDVIDQDYATLYDAIARGSFGCDLTPEAIMLLVLVMRALERIGDHCLNISRRIWRFSCR